MAEAAPEQAQAVAKEVSSSLQRPAQIEDEDEILEPAAGYRDKQKAKMVADWRRQAQVAAKIRDFDTAENFYLQILAYEIPEDERREVLLEMAKLFEASGESSKQAAVLEKFAEAFPDDPGLPQVYIKLGILYRSLGLSELALARFYAVLNYSLKIDAGRIDSYRQMTIRAQMEIADTHFAGAKYSEAIKFYSRLRLLDLSAEDRAKALFQTANCHYLLNADPDAIANFESFIATYPNDGRTPEAMFTLANAYTRVGRLTDASRVVLELLKRQSANAEENEKEWIFWQKKAGTQLANNFFNQNDFSSALALYQAMAELSNQVDWVWPIVYQMAQCYEKLGMNAKAAETYKKILEWPQAQRTEALKVAALKSTYEMAQWKLDNLDWRGDTSQKLEKLLDKTSN